MFADRAKIIIRSGKGGDGHVSFAGKSMWLPAARTAGRRTGRRCNFQVDKGLNTLGEYRYSRKFSAGNGEEGGKRRCHGKDGADIILKVRKERLSGTRLPEKLLRICPVKISGW